MNSLRPKAYHLQDPSVEMDLQEDVFAEHDLPQSDESAVEEAQARGIIARGLMSWGTIFWSALTALISMALSASAYDLVSDFFARSAALGALALTLLSLIIIAALIFITREVRGLFRQRYIADLHQAFARAHEMDDRDAARLLVGRLASLYENRPTTARARSELARLREEIIDGRDLVELTERYLVSALDDEATREIARAAKRVSVVTAISPRAIIDLLFVLGQAVQLIRRIAEIYGGRPGFFGFLRIAKSVAAHLAITGGMAAGDSLVQQALGHGIAAKLSARLGEGVLNGMMSARIGLSAMALCRPLPFLTKPTPGVSDVAPFLLSRDK